MDRYRTAKHDLREAQKPAYGAPAYSRFVNRPVGRRLAAASYCVGLTPNGVTSVSALFSLSAIVLLVAVPTSIAQGIAVALLLLIGYAFDSADGQLARLRGGGSPEGEWLDHTVDMAKGVLLHGAVLIAWIRFLPDLSWGQALLPILFATVSSVSLFGWLLVDLLRRSSGLTEPIRSGRPPMWRTLLRTPSDYGLLCLAFLLWGTPAFLWVYALLLVANAAILMMALPVWFRQAKGSKGSP